MFSLAFLTGSFAYLIFLVGLLGFLTQPVISIIVSLYLFFLLVLIVLNFKKINFKNYKNSLKPIEFLSLVFLFLFTIVHLIGALGPEIFYDALWYHLTLPKLYLLRGEVYHVPGNLFYYSEMPRLIEMLYTAAISLTDEIGAKIIHYLFALATAFTIFVFGKKHFNTKVAFIASLIFFSDLSVAWQATTAYVDLGRTFFETLGFFFFLDWWESRSDYNLAKSGMSLGLALATKYHAFGSIAILAFLIFLLAKNKKLITAIKFLIPAIAVPLPWLVSSYLTTGNPVYPLFSGVLDKSHDLVFRGFLNFFLDFFRLSNLPNDWISPISPLYLVLLPLSLFSLLKFKKVQVVGLYLILAYIVWFLTPRTGGSRFIMPYLPILSLFVASFFALNINRLRLIQAVSVLAIFSVSLGHLLLRTYVNGKNVPVIFGWQSKHDFLVENLDFTNAFYDVDGYFEKNIGQEDLVYIIGGQNLYYVNFPFTHDTFGEDKKYNYILTQYKDLPKEFGDLKPVYENPKTYVKLFKLAETK